MLKEEDIHQYIFVNNIQMEEIVEIKWISIMSLKDMTSNDIYSIITNMQKILKKQRKNKYNYV
jgi:hypothetical protein